MRENTSAECPELSGEALERHLFVCEACRTQARISTAWRALASPDADDASAIREAFLARVLSSRRQDSRRIRRRRCLLAAAALLLFFFCAGGGHRRGLDPGPDRRAEEAFANLTSPSELEAFLPD